MSMFYIGGELAQSRLGLPKSLTGVFQGLLLFTLLACDTLIAYRIRWTSSHATAPSSAALPASQMQSQTQTIDDAPPGPVVASSNLPTREST